MENNINDELEQYLFEEEVDEEEQKIFYKKLASSLDDTLVNINIYGDEDDR